ncbi:YL1 nuclear protein-domain-containing protein [Fusarium redolens]|uniref:YL1 nuclear protein-domain-containing protein n=1 Tax=Fusarium redolens TaxID=48865 RepID=A0A9P9K526_FUSRE|nr:YL1 nuclear protein-domain-containing protein [Fusarium redolens]KAH7244305.1 YL1 nuclear protein-domain-containing protein [Fusarium redolens]
METESKPSDMGTPLSSTLSSLSDSDSDSDAEVPKSTGPNNDIDSQANNEDTVEWLATTRKRRSTAGNRMKSMLANEEPDSDLELLFAEDENDQGFSDAEVNGSDVQMDSSDDEDENDNNDDDLEGEKELEKQAKERRAAQRKRKAQEAIPAKFRKKVRIDPTTRTPAPAKPAPRPKKKSERTSWLPSAADLPTRASSRQTTRLSKEQLHQQMVEREARRIKQLAQMQKKAAKLEAMKKPPMTQEERLREAAIVEKRNSKSLNRWEEAEKQREEERRAKLAALHNRTLKGPVITFWSGIGEWMGRHMVIEEPAKEKRKRGEKAKGKEKEKAASTEDKKEDGQNGEVAKAKEESQPSQNKPPSTASTEPAAASDPKDTKPATPTKAGEDITKPTDTPSTSETSGAPPAVPKTEDVPPLMTMPPPPQPPPTPPSSLLAPAPPPSTFVPAPSPPRSQDPPPSGLAAPPLPPPTSAGSASTTNSFVAPPSGLSRPPDSKPSGVLAAPILAPPPGIGINGNAPPMMGFGSPKSNVLAPPNTSQGAMPPTLTAAAPPHNIPSVISPPPSNPSTGVISISSMTKIQPKTITPALLTKSTSPDTPVVAQPPDSQPQPPQPSTGARNAIVFQNFDDNALKDRSIQTQIIFGRKMNKLSKPSPAPLCVITNHPARYRDPRTGLPYYNAYAYREIQRLTRGEYRWSHILGAWVGSGTYAARGVPERFLNPGKKGPEKKSSSDEGVKDKGAVKAPDQAQVPQTKTPDVPSGIPTTGDKMTGVEQGASAPPNPEPNQTIQPKMAPPAVTQPTNATNTTAATAVAPTTTPAPEPKTQAPTNPQSTTVGNPPAPAQTSQ